MATWGRYFDVAKDRQAVLDFIERSRRISSRPRSSFSSSFSASSGCCGSSSVHNLRFTALRDVVPLDIRSLKLQQNRRAEENVLLCRTFTLPSRVGCTYFGVEDTSGACIALALYNFFESLSLEDVEKRFPLGTLFGVVAPLLKTGLSGELIVRCDTPGTHLCRLQPSSPSLRGATSWYVPMTGEELRLRGNELFREDDKYGALECYSNALRVSGEGADCDLRVLNNRAQCFLDLERFLDAFWDAEAVLKVDGTNSKAVFRRGMALLGLRRWAGAIESLENARKMSVETGETRVSLFDAPIARAKRALELQSSANFDFPSYMRRNSDNPQLALWSELPDYFGPMVYRENMGFFATEDIKCGEWVLVEAPMCFEWKFAVDDNVGEISDNELVSSVGRRLAARLAEMAEEDSVRERWIRALAVRLRCPDMDGAHSILTLRAIQRIVGCISYNSMVLPVFDFKKASPMYVGKGFYSRASRFGHKCTYNVRWQIVGGMMFCHTVRDVKAGEELCITFVSPLEEPVRLAAIVEESGFVCNCKWCTNVRNAPVETQRESVAVGRLQEEFFAELQKCRENIWSPSTRIAFRNRLEAGALQRAMKVPFLPSPCLYRLAHHMAFFWQDDVQQFSKWMSVCWGALGPDDDLFYSFDLLRDLHFAYHILKSGGADSNLVEPWAVRLRKCFVTLFGDDRRFLDKWYKNAPRLHR